MAERPPTTGRRYRRPSRRLYEDFEPTTTFLEKDGAALLQVSLSGFKREQINTKYDEALRFTYPRVRQTPARITIQGERPIGNNKWSRFYKQMDIPGDCDATGTQTKLEGGIFTITIPKKKVAQEASLPREVGRPRQEPPSPQETIAEVKHHEKDDSSSLDDKKQKEEKLSPLAKVITETKVQQDQEDTSLKLIDKKRMASTEKPDEEKMLGKKQRSKETKDSKEPNHPDENVAGTSASASAKRKHTGETSKESSTDENSAARNLDKGKGRERTIAATGKHAMKPLAISHKEEMQLFVNMGAALAVIMALGAHIGVTFWT